MKKRTNAYWEQRAEARMDAALRDSQKTLDTLSRAYKRALVDVEDDIQDIYRVFRKAFDLGPDEAKKLLNAPCGRGEYLKILDTIDRITDERVKRRLLAQAGSGSYSTRLSRLEALKQSIGAQAMRLADIESGLVTEAMGKTITETFHRTMYDIQRGTGAGFAFTAPDTQAVREILSNPWSGQHFSERIWKNGAALADELNEKLTADFLTGRSAARAAQEIATDFGVRYREAERLVRTETCYMANAAEMASYAECGMDKYRYVATLDKITSPPCRKLDGKVFYVKDAMPGENCPPMHPNCRSTTIGVLDDDAMAEMTRKAQDPITGEFVDVPATMNYEEWQALQEVHYGKERMALLQRMTANKAADREQYGRYKKLLGEGNVPESFAKFQKMKYNNIKEWNEQKALYRDVNWQVKAQEKITKGAAHTVPNEGEPSSVFDNYGEDGELLARRYYGVTGKKRLDIDLSAHGNPKKHPIVPHAHTISEETGVREHKGRELSKAERIANKDILKE